jgi:hypothetical protein
VFINNEHALIDICIASNNVDGCHRCCVKSQSCVGHHQSSRLRHAAVKPVRLCITALRELLIEFYCMRFQVLTAASMKLGVFWNVLPCSRLDVDIQLRTRQHIPEDSEIRI